MCKMHYRVFMKRFMKFHEKAFTFWKNHAILKLQKTSELAGIQQDFL